MLSWLKWFQTIWNCFVSSFQRCCNCLKWFGLVCKGSANMLMVQSSLEMRYGFCVWYPIKPLSTIVRPTFFSIFKIFGCLDLHMVTFFIFRNISIPRATMDMNCHTIGLRPDRHAWDRFVDREHSVRRTPWTVLDVCSLVSFPCFSMAGDDQR